MEEDLITKELVNDFEGINQAIEDFIASLK
jgi:hypothetical protein